VSASPVETSHVFTHPPPAEQYVPPLEHSHSYNPPSHDYAVHAMSLAPINTENTGSLDPQLANGGNHFPAINGGYGSSMMPPAAMPDRRFSFDASSVSVPVCIAMTFAALLRRLAHIPTAVYSCPTTNGGVWHNVPSSLHGEWASVR